MGKAEKKEISDLFLKGENDFDNFQIKYLD
jgi:hypothetical protein